MAKDPVCWMEVDEKEAGSKYVYKGETFYFCTPRCKKTFSISPEKYLTKDRKSTRLNSSHIPLSRMPSSA